MYTAPSNAFKQVSASNRQPWLRLAVALGAAYAAVGLFFALPGGHIKAWRWAAWLVSAGFYASHIWRERFTFRTPPFPAALHVASAAAIGAFGLAVAANIHSLRLHSDSHHQQLMVISLGLWPAITGIPAFLIAWAASAILALVLPQD